VATSDLEPARPAPRPANSVLDNTALRTAGFAELAHHRIPLQDLVDHLSRESGPA
jgi:dTDP-4-dehydrorhamnose reductase